MRVVRVGALNVGYGIPGAEPRKSVDVRVRVIPENLSIIKPQNPVESESAFEFSLNFITGKIFIPVHACQAAGRGEHCSASVCVDAAALQYERPHVNPEHIVIEGS